MNRYFGVSKKALIIFFAVFLIFSFSCKKKEAKKEEVIKIGAILPLTGASSLPGEHILNGLKLSLLRNPRFKLIIEDSKNVPKEGLSAFNKLVTVDKVDIMITALSSVSLTIIPQLSEKKIPTFITLSNYPDIAAKSEWTFRFFINSTHEAHLLVKFLFNRGIKTIGIIHMNDEGSLKVASAIREIFTGEGGIVKHEETFDMIKQDFKDIAIKAGNWKVEAMGVIGYGKPLGILISQLRSAQIKIPLVSTTPMAASDAQSAAGDAVFTDLYYISPSFDFNRSPEADSFRNLYKRNYGKEADFLAAYGFDLGNLIAKVAEELGFKFDSKEYIKHVYNYYGRGTCGMITVDKNREIVSDIVVVSKQTKEPVVVYPVIGK